MEFLRGVAKVFADSVSEEEIRGSVEAFSGKIFVFPSRRSSKFFIKYLGECWAQRFSKPMLTPQVCTISDLFSKMGGLETVDPVEASILLYREYVRLSGSQESFDDFLRWGEVLLADFNDIDNYLIDSNSIFTNIKDLKELDGDLSYLSDSQIEAIKRFWSSFHIRSKKSISQKEDSIDIKKEFTKVWMILPQLYADFKSVLLEKGKGYNGMIYRSVAERIANGERCWETDGRFQQNEEKISEYVFIGFNAPNKCEEALLEAMKREGCGDFYWDFVSPLVRCKENKASLWVESLEKRFPAKHPEYLEYIKIEEGYQPEIKVIAVPGAVQQAELAGEILGRVKDVDHFNTAVILPQEEMLFPLLNNIPVEYDSVNVSMGYPMKLTPLGAFTEKIILLFKGMNGGKFYHKDVKAVLLSDCIKSVLSKEVESILGSIVKRNLIYISRNEILEMIDTLWERPIEWPETKSGKELLKCIFSVNAATWQDIAHWQIEILKSLDLISDKTSKEFIALQYKAIEKILEYDGMEEISIQTFFRMEMSLLDQITVPFMGEPLRGLQVVGPLETRALDFDNLIILNVNEGVYPKAYSNNSFIPYLLRKGFGLPTFELADAVAAYHFYRGIYRSKKIWLLYDTRTEGTRSGEVSRFVKQLKYHHNVSIEEITVQNASLNGKMEESIEVVKSEEIVARLKERFIVGESEDTKAFSASSLINYMFCPLKFYLNNVLEIQEEEDIEEGMEANTFGTIFHDTMENIYSPFKGKVVNRSDLEKLLSDIDNQEGTVQRILLKQFEKQKFGEPKGQNYISFKVLLKCIELTLKQDAGILEGSLFSTPFTYLDGEKKLEFDFEVNDTLKIRLKAKIDRLDSKEGNLRVSDYKTGFVDTITKEEGNNLPYSLFPSAQKEFSHKVWFQLFFYAMVLLEEKIMEKESIEAAVYKVKSIMNSPVSARSITKDEILLFREKLKEIIMEIFNPNIPFHQAQEGSRQCEHCMFRSICKR